MLFGAVVGKQIIDESRRSSSQNSVWVSKRVGQVGGDCIIRQVRNKTIQQIAATRTIVALAHDRCSHHHPYRVKTHCGAIAVWIGDNTRTQDAVVIAWHD